MKKQKFSKVVKNWYNSFLGCYGEPTLKDEAKSFYTAGFDDGAGAVCIAMRDSGIPVDTIRKIYALLDRKNESFTGQLIVEDWLDEF